MRRPLVTIAAIAIALTIAPKTRGESAGPATLSGWAEYVRATEARIAAQLERTDGFLALDFLPAREEARRALVAGQVRVTRVEPATLDGRARTVSDGLVHHWRGSVFVPGSALDPMLVRLADPRPGDFAQEDVVAARVIERGPGSLRLFLRLRRSQFVTAVYNTEHLVRFTRHGERRASSRSTAVRIAEVADPGSPTERERPIGEDRGFLWGLNAYWRYEQIAAGVLVECESVSLSRDVPALVRAAVRPLIDQLARESMERTLLATRARFTRATSQGE